MRNAETKPRWPLAPSVPQIMQVSDCSLYFIYFLIFLIGFRLPMPMDTGRKTTLTRQARGTQWNMDGAMDASTGASTDAGKDSA